MTVGYAAVTVALAAFPTATMVMNGVLVGNVSKAAGSGVSSPEARSAFLALVVLGALSFVAWVTESLGAVLREHMARLGGRRWDQELMEAVAAPTTIAHLEDSALLDRLEAAAGRTRAGPSQAVAVVGPVVTEVLTGLFAVALVAHFSPWLATALLVHAIASRVHWRARFDRITAALFGHGDLHRRSGYLRDLVLAPAAAKEVRVFGLAGWLRDRFHSEWHGAMQAVWPRMRQGWARSYGLSVTWAALLAAGGWLVVTAAIDGRISVAFAVITLQAMVASEAVGTTNDFQHLLAEGADRLPRHQAMVAELRALSAAGARQALPVPKEVPRERISLCGVRFRYPGAADWVIDGLDLDIEAGTSIAIVGVNGAGKTTLVKLLTGLHQPAEGQILVDGVPLDIYDPREWQRQVSAIFQDFWRYPLSARANIAFGAPDRIDDHVALERATARAGAKHVIDALPHGSDTVLDRQFEGGVELSGGQWQRIALARSLFAVEAGARVLVLDEPTAALDVRAEADIYDRFLDITRGLTSIVISHRFSTVRRADRIVVLQAGKVVEDGTHASLMSAGAQYARMFELQAARYRDGEETADDLEGSQT